MSRFSFLCFIAVPMFLRAEVVPQALFTDHAVLQQGVAVPVWGKARDGEAITVQIAGLTQKTVAKDGRWSVLFENVPPGGPYTLTMKGDNLVEAHDVLVGEVWLCAGQSNMARTVVPPDTVQPRIAAWEEQAAKANHPEIRHFRVANDVRDEPAEDVKGSWVVCSPETVRDFTAVGYYFARDLLQFRKTPIGLINTSVGATGIGSWSSPGSLKATEAGQRMLAWRERSIQDYPSKLEKYKADEPRLRKEYEEAVEKARAQNQPLPRPPRLPRDPEADPYRFSGYFNGMIAPLPPYAIRGVLWYQGEADAGQSGNYRTLFPELIKTWRDLWNHPEMPFLFVQIAPFKKSTPEIREVQTQIWKKTPHTAMVGTADCGDSNDVHPVNKEPVGARLALAARAVAYGDSVEYSGPVFEGIKKLKTRKP
jgi:sialate O-acetylesterase